MTDKAKFCTFCGSETDNADISAKHKEQYDEYQQVAAILALEIELKIDMIQHDQWTKEELIELFEDLADVREKTINDKEYRENRYNTLGMLFNLNVKE